ncbi:hypothetical protein [Fodinibius salsisoli]|uniref:Uncharacterized protein n=1 Tax=Fodinibius salsisoli TaxID=2820877 RepID=A0ABT3PIH2_9BACT|nr:hypothetical protein [Fodinibius salsisoli]MCW9705717.1 hypothetical protein [Fodinibius salsisoli]
MYYASDFLHSDEDGLIDIEQSVNHTMKVFRTLNIPLEEHFYLIFRSKPHYIYKDWKLSGLACVYMLMNGDPDDVNNLAQQQTTLIDQMLHHMNPSQLSHIKNAYR